MRSRRISGRMLGRGWSRKAFFICSEFEINFGFFVPVFMVLSPCKAKLLFQGGNIMSWAEIKKAVNSNLSKPLDKYIEEKAEEILNLNTEMMASYNNRQQLFTENGTFTVPNGVKTLLITAVASGGDGGNGTRGGEGSNSGTGGGGGGAGQWCLNKPVNVKPGEVIDVTVGTGNTRFGSYVTLTKGGNGGGGGGGGGNSGFNGTGGAGGAGGAGGPGALLVSW